MYPHVQGGIECCGCLLGKDQNFTSIEGAWNHLLEHRRAGHQVPEYAFEGILGDNLPEGYIWVKRDAETRIV
jgi:hypothetical protein